MPTRLSQAPSICARCFRARRNRVTFPNTPCVRLYSESRKPPKDEQQSNRRGEANQPSVHQQQPTLKTKHDTPQDDDAKGALSRRLEEATEEALLTGGTSGRRAVEEAGFSDELKERLLDRVKTAGFRKHHANAFATAGLDSSRSPSSSTASSPSSPPAFSDPSEPWTGTETQPDAVLRMLDDARKPLDPESRGKYQIPNPVDLRPRPAPRLSAGQRAANARDKASLYTGMGMGTKEQGTSIKNEKKGPGDAKAQGPSESEREAFKREMRERFNPGARTVTPATVSAVASLASERIEDAIARGAFRDIPRGKDAAPRDERVDNPFVDTTEYLMNKLIQRQEIVPPWIEKQQEVASAAGKFRARMRSDWRRHAARMIASEGGSLEDQVARARAHARAEERVNPLRRVAAGAVVPGTATDHVVMVNGRESAVEADLAATAADAVATAPPTYPPPLKSSDQEEEAGPSSGPSPTSAHRHGDCDSSPATEPAAAAPFRDPDWEAAESTYMRLSIDNLNAMTRSYNLMAPDLAKKPYFSLERELSACFAEVAPLLADTIRERATRPAKSLLSGVGEATPKASMFGQLGNDGARVRDSKAPHYGFKEMWKDFWGSKSSESG